MSRIGLGDTQISIFLKMSDGNPGALSVMMQLLEKGGQIDPDSFMGGLGAILSMDTLEIYGSEIWMLYKDVCGENIVNMCAVLRAHQLGYITYNQIKHAINNRGEGLDVASELKKVKERLPKFGATAPTL